MGGGGEGKRRARERLPGPFHVHGRQYLGAMSQLDARIDEIVRSLVRDVAAGIHGMYRGDARQQTTQLRLSTFAKEAGDKLRTAISVSGGTPVRAPGAALSAPASPPAAGAPALTPEEVAAITRCVMAWLPLGGAPNAATPEMKCMSGAREMCPTWGDREAARLAVRRLSGDA